MQRGSAPTDSFAADPQVYEILANSCFDCHSDRGSGSWNAKLAPSYLFGAQQRTRGPEFLELGDAGCKAAERDGIEIAAVVDSGSMPPGDYDFFHPSAKLSDAAKEARASVVLAANSSPGSLTRVTVDSRRAENSHREKDHTDCKRNRRRPRCTGRTESANHQVVERVHGPRRGHPKRERAHPIRLEVERPPASANR